jgi:hypothetical protein
VTGSSAGGTKEIYGQVVVGIAEGIETTMKLRRLGALLTAAVLSLAAYGTAAAVGPGNNGLDKTGNGTTSNATVSGSLPDAGGSATMNTAEMLCDGTSVGSVSGSFTLTKTLDVGSVITVYLVPNTGAVTTGNVTKNETSVTLTSADNTSGSIIPWSITVTSPFTVSSGGVLGVFAVNADLITAISSSKTNSLNCSEATPTPTPSPTPTGSSGGGGGGTPSPSPSPTPTGSGGGGGGGAGGTPSPSPSPTNSGGGGGAGGGPTQPPTDTLSTNSSGPSDGAWLLVVALGVLLASVVVLTPARAKNRR